MFSEISGSFEGLTSDQRSLLADQLEIRNEYNQALLTLNKMRIDVLRNYTEAGEQRLTDFSSMVIAPIRARMQKQTRKLTEEAIDIEGILELLPMLLAGVVSKINVPLFLTTIGLEPDSIEELVNLTKDFFKQGM